MQVVDGAPDEHDAVNVMRRVAGRERGQATSGRHESLS
jgi:hypothetical protein